MNGLKITIANPVVSPREPLLVSGEVWFTLGDKDFPAAHWTDSPVSVLGSLCEAIDSAEKGEVGEVYFFDGPYYVKLVPGPADGRGEVEAIAVCDRAGQISGTGEGVAEARCHVSLDSMRAQYTNLLGDLEGWARQHGHAEVAEQLSRMVRHPRRT
ncbi:hypothetical protein [Streptomyces sp. NPDC006510]|uniref:hypothetical protein n=1 Tax=Streptomyces sp. NPDC006510 TaxID=3155600 RepID=UPI0033B0D981